MKTNTFYKYTYIAIVIFYCIVLSQFGMETWDTGYISSFSWRIVNGQNIYEDFLYKFPPVTIYLHAFFMKILPDTGQFFYFRIIAYLSHALQVYLFVSGIYLIYDIKKINKWALMIVCFMISWMNFSPYPWPTTDGIFFASIAFWITAKSKSNNFTLLFLVALCSLLSALSKQSFYLVPFLFLLWFYLKFGLKSALLYFSVLFLLFVLFVLIILSITSWANFSKQLNGELRLLDLYNVGFHNYVFLPIRHLLGVLFLGFSSLFFYLKKTNKKMIYLAPHLVKISLLLIVTSILFFLLNKSWTASFLAFDAAFIGVLYSFFVIKKTYLQLYPAVLLLVLAWSVSISLGYPAPLLFGTGIILSLVALLENEIKLKQKYYFLIGLAMCLFAFASNKYPYRENSVFELKYSLENISPKLKFIKTNKGTFEKHEELKQLITKYGGNFIVSPNMPMSNYLFNEQSQLPTDWLIETEVNRQMAKIINLCADKKNFIFIEKSFANGEDYGNETITTSSMAWFVYKKFNKIEETKYFIIYNQIKTNEKLP